MVAYHNRGTVQIPKFKKRADDVTVSIRIWSHCTSHTPALCKPGKHMPDCFCPIAGHCPPPLRNHHHSHFLNDNKDEGWIIEEIPGNTNGLRTPMMNQSRRNQPRFFSCTLQSSSAEPMCAYYTEIAKNNNFALSPINTSEHIWPIPHPGTTLVTKRKKRKRQKRGSKKKKRKEGVMEKKKKQKEKGKKQEREREKETKRKGNKKEKREKKRKKRRKKKRRGRNERGRERK